ncbi:YARHG domain-containing protein [Pedobacter sp. MW01-1-1]|uniref:YARHG domain-containing protein n=1 Tax=Pedobacter sp. MW01-1-1 TaxID=3383027 RepID=UPI003FEF6A8B
MKQVLLISLISLLMFSCSNRKSSNSEDSSSIISNDEVIEEEIHKELYGSWVGYFGYGEDKWGYTDGDYTVQDKLNIIIKRITKDKVVAQYFVEGKRYQLEGKFYEADMGFILDEPSEAKRAGRFTFKLFKDSLVGTWVPFDNSLDIPNREYKLAKKEFAYNAELMLPSEESYVDWGNEKRISTYDTLDDGTIDTFINVFSRSASSESVAKLNASTTLLTEQDLKNLKKLELEIIKNTVYARHGYAFQKETFRRFFDPVEWYIPLKTNVDSELTSVENKNVKIIDRFIKYAEDNYDAFGR